MQEQHCHAVDTHVTSPQGDYFSYCKRCTQHHYSTWQYHSGSDLRCDSIQVGKQEPNRTGRYPGKHEYQPEHTAKHQSSGPFQPGHQNCTNELANQLHALPRHYGPAFNAKLKPDTNGTIGPVDLVIYKAATELDSQELKPEQPARGPSPRSDFRDEFRHLKSLIVASPPTRPKEEEDVGELSKHTVTGDAVRALPKDATTLVLSNRQPTPPQEDVGYLSKHIIAGDAVPQALPPNSAPLTYPTPPVTPPLGASSSRGDSTDTSAAIAPPSCIDVSTVTATSPSAPSIPNPIQHSTEEPSFPSRDSASRSPRSPPSRADWALDYGTAIEDKYGDWDDDVQSARDALATRPLGTNGNVVLRVVNPMVPGWVVSKTMEDE